jgi:nucleoid-associated protein YgaU
MHSIERYGIVALLFLVVTVVAVLMWDGGKKKKPDETVGKNPAPLVETEAEAPRAIDPANRLSLVAPSAPGPLVRKLDGQLPAAAERATEGQGLPLAEELSEEPTGQPAADPATILRPTDEPAPVERPVANVPAATRAYVVKSGDTLSEIAQRELGSSRRWQEIADANPDLDPNRLRAGKTIRLPGSAGAEGRSKTAATAPTKAATSGAQGSHKVAKGESLWKIAERRLGDGKRWKEIVALNPGLDADKLVLGQVLKLPAGASAPKASSTPRKQESKPKPAEPVVAAADERPARRGSKVK